MMIKLVSAKVLGAKALRLTFSDGSEGDFDFASVLARDTVLTRPLEQPEYFERYFLELGALCWPNGLEFSARSLHKTLEAAGVLRHHAAA
jgi:hypothetical protein